MTDERDNGSGGEVSMERSEVRIMPHMICVTEADGGAVFLNASHITAVYAEENGAAETTILSGRDEGSCWCVRENVLDVVARIDGEIGR